MWGNINELYSVIFILNGKTCFKLFIIPFDLEHLFGTFSICLCQLRYVSNVWPKILKCWTISMFSEK